jgi:hypothetical protein
MFVSGTLGQPSIFSNACKSDAEFLKASIADVKRAASERSEERGERRAEEEERIRSTGPPALRVIGEKREVIVHHLVLRVALHWLHPTHFSQPHFQYWSVRSGS